MARVVREIEVEAGAAVEIVGQAVAMDGVGVAHLGNQEVIAVKTTADLAG